jgi:hypothetical protein
MTATEVEQLRMEPFTDSAGWPPGAPPAAPTWYVVLTQFGQRIGEVVRNGLTGRWEWRIAARVLPNSGPCAGPAAGFEAVKRRLSELG